MKKASSLRLQANRIIGKTPFVSVIIPVFNGGQFLAEAVESVQKSTYKHFEVLLVDDGSTDASKSICKKLTQKYTNVRFFSFPKNRGMDHALNLALHKARGTYIARINQDDVMLPHRLTTQVKYLGNHAEIVAVGSSIVLFDNQGYEEHVPFLTTDAEIKDVWFILSPFSDPTVMYRRAAAIAVGGYDQSFWPADDVHMWYRLGLAGKLANLARPVTRVRWHVDAGSVKHYHRLIRKTYKLHMWTNKHIKSAPWYIQLFWLCQLAAGLTLSPHTNWAVYRVIKRIIGSYEARKEALWEIRTHRKSATSVATAPKKLSLSGV